MRITIILSFLALLSFQATAQGLDSFYDTKERSEDLKNITAIYGGLDQDSISEKEFFHYLSKNIYSGDPERDAIVKIRMSEIYYYVNGSIVKAIHNWLTLLTKYSNLCNEEDLEFANRKAGEAYFVSENYILARQFFLESLKYENKKVTSYIYARIGSTYMEGQDYESSIEWYLKSLDHAVTLTEKVAHRNSLGYIYYLNKDFDNSELSLVKAKSDYLNESDEVDEIQLLIIQSNLASLYISKGEVAKGIEYLQSIENSNRFKIEGTWFKVELYSKYIDAYLKMSNCSKANKYLELFSAALPVDSFDKDYLKFLKSKISIVSNCGGRLNDVVSEYVIKEDSIRNQENLRNNIVQNIQRSVYKDQIDLVSTNLTLKEESESTLELANTRLRRLFWISGVLFLVVVFFFVIRFRQNRLKRDLVLEKEKSTDLSIKMAEQQIENKKLELSKILTNIDKSSSLSEEVLARLSILKQKDGDVKDDISQLIQFINSMSRTNSINELVEKNSDVLGFGLKERIEKRFPNLTPSELQLIILIRIGLSTKEVAQLKNVEPTSVRIFKHRLKVKLEVPKELDLNRFVSEL